MRIGSSLSVGLVLAMAVMLTQARFIAKRETAAGLEQAVASTSTINPDIVMPARESGSGGELGKVKGESEMDTAKSEPEDEGGGIEAGKAKDDSHSTSEDVLGKKQIDLTEKETTEAPLKKAFTAAIKEDSKSTATILSETKLSPISKASEKEQSQKEPEQKILETTAAPALAKTSTTEHIPEEKGVQESQAEKQPKIDGKIDMDATSTTTERVPLREVTLEVSSTTERAVNATTRSSDHARSMLYSTTTEEALKLLAAVTPMKLRPLPMTSTPGSTTITTTTIAATTTPASIASHENVIEESNLQSEVRQLPEKRAKFISENSTNAQQLTLPNTAVEWSLAGMKAVPKAPPSPTTSTTTVVPLFNHTDLANDIELPQNRTEQQKEKNLLDWQHVAMMQSMPENRTEFVVRTTLDATEGATQATTEALNEEETVDKSEIPTLTVTPAIPYGSSTVEMDMGVVNITTTTVRSEILDVPMVKKMSEVAKAKLTEATTEAQTEPQAITEAVAAAAATESLLTEPPVTTATFESNLTEQQITEADSNLTEQQVTEALTARVALTKTEILNVTNEQATTTTTTTTEPPLFAEIELTTATTTATVATTAAEATPTTISNSSATPNSTEMAMKAADDYAENENADNNSNDVIVATTKQPVREQFPPATATSVSVRVTGEVSTSIRPEISSSSARVLSSIASTATTSTTTSTTTTTTTEATPTQTEIAQISNEVNLEAVTVKSVREEEDTRNNFSLSNANELITAEKTDSQAVNNSVAITEPTATPLGTITIATTTEGGASTLLSDLSKLNKEHESSLETNNIGEVPETTTTAGVAVATDERTAAAAAAAEAAATGGQEGEKELHHHEAEQVVEEQDTKQQLAKTTMAVTTTTSTTTTSTTTTEMPSNTRATTTTMQPPLISLLDDTTTRTTTTTTTAEPPTEVYSESSSQRIPLASSSSSSTTTTTTTTMLPETTSTTTSSTTTAQPPTMPPTFMAPYPNELDHMQSNAQGNGTDVNVIIAITVSVIGVVALILLVAFLYLMRKRQKQTSYGQRCRPVSLDAYSLDNVSVLGSVRRKGRDVRASKRTYGNAAFDDPSLRHNPLTAGELARFLERRSDVFEEFRDVPQIIARADEVPPGCEDKNRYANVIPLPETRVVLQRQGDDDKTEYINANYVRGPRDAPNYYIACQAPLESTTSDFWRMIWEQQSRVIIQATDLSENGIEKCAEYLPPSATLDNHSSYGDYQVTLKHREVKDRYAISTLVLKRFNGEESRELTHYWYKWPEAGVPAEEAPIIAMLLEARSSLKSYCLEQANELRGKSATLETSMDAESGLKAEASSTSSNEINGNISSRNAARNQQGPLTVHCSPGTGRTGTIIASDMAIRSLETPKRSVDIPQLVYYVRRGRASAVQTKEQYEFIYKVASMYAAKITNLSNDN
ncbi:hypothetical protein KR009_003301 [Drosophila setifemur]|nr:hypothetical protein KR009_003301 [Drosophila setifemur]